VFALYVTGSLNVVLSKEHQREICRYIYNHQNEDGGWGMQELGQSTMFSSCLNYVTLRLLGEMCTHEALTRGSAWILSHGSAAAIPQWGKIWLSVHLEIIKTLTILFLVYEFVFRKATS